MTYNQATTMAYYRELEEKDSDVANCLDSLKMSVTKRQRSVAPANDKDSRAVDTMEFIEAQLAAVDFDAVLDCILDAAGYGFSVQELMFDVSAGQASLTGIDDCPQELFLFGDRFRPQVGPLQLLESPWASSGAEVPENKFLITTYRKRGRDRMGRPLLKEVFWDSWFKRNVLRFWLKFAEKGPGTAVVRYADSSDPEQKQLAADLAQSIVDGTAVGVPANFQIELELLKTARAQDPAVYQKLKEHHQYSIARRILGETLTSFGNEGGTGSKAQGDVHADTFDSRSMSLCSAVEKVVNLQLVAPLVLWNFGPDAPMPVWSLDKKQKQDLLQRINIDATAQRMGKKIPVGYMNTTYQIPLAQGEDAEDPNDVLVPNAAAPNVAITDQARASFSEGKDQAAGELKQFDALFADLAAKSRRVMKARIGELAAEARPAVVK